MPTPEELDEYGLVDPIFDGIPMLIVTAPDGTETAYPADRYRILQPGSDASPE